MLQCKEEGWIYKIDKCKIPKAVLNLSRKQTTPETQFMKCGAEVYHHRYI